MKFFENLHLRKAWEIGQKVSFWKIKPWFGIAIMKNFIDSVTKMQVQDFENITLTNRKPITNLQEERVFIIQKQV